MKKIWLMLLMVCAVCAFSACSDDDEDGPASQNPVTNAKVPATAEIGSEITVTGTGFAANAQLFFKNSANEKTNVTNADFTASGAILTIPMGLTAGEYSLYLVQSGEWELGKITLTAASLPVIGLTIPAEGWIGKKLTIGGSGYNSTAKVYLEDAAGERAELANPDITSGFVAKIPATVEAGSYKLILVQDGGEWVLEGAFKVVVAPVIKRIKQINTTVYMGMDYTNLESAFQELAATEDGKAILEAYGMELFGKPIETPEEFKQLCEAMTGGGEEQTSIKEFVYNDGKLVNVKEDEAVVYEFVSTESQIKGTNKDAKLTSGVKSFILNVTDNRVDNSSVDYKSVGEKSFDWKYNVDGYWQGVYNASSGTAKVEYGFEEGNFISVDGQEHFEYKDGEQKNNPYAIDMAMFLYSEIRKDDNEVFAVLLGLCGNRSVNLPSATNLFSGEMIPLNYGKDGDGYVTSAKVSINMGDVLGLGLPTIMAYTYGFEYEVVDYE